MTDQPANPTFRIHLQTRRNSLSDWYTVDSHKVGILDLLDLAAEVRRENRSYGWAKFRLTEP